MWTLQSLWEVILLPDSYFSNEIGGGNRRYQIWPTPFSSSVLHPTSTNTQLFTKSSLKPTVPISKYSYRQLTPHYASYTTTLPYLPNSFRPFYQTTNTYSSFGLGEPDSNSFTVVSAPVESSTNNNKHNVTKSVFFIVSD